MTPRKVPLALGFLLSLALVGVCFAACQTTPPGDLVYLHDVEPSIVQDIRYAQWPNFVGHKIKGYAAAECLLTLQAARALQIVQRKFLQGGYSLPVYDCYRPDRAVRQFVACAIDGRDNTMKTEFYPRLMQSQLLRSGYIAANSAHSRASTVDIAIVRQTSRARPIGQAQGAQKSCNSPNRSPDDSIEFGTNYDCMDELSHTQSPLISVEARKHRRFLVSEMCKGGFQNFYREWWHFTLRREPYPDTCFDFLITARPADTR
jgi:zinc D-Ala-D-Ala dipeptidase